MVNERVWVREKIHGKKKEVSPSKEVLKSVGDLVVLSEMRDKI